MTDRNRDLLTECGIDVEARQIMLFGEVGVAMCVRLILGLRILKADDPIAPITLLINSYGGEVVQAFAMMEAIETSGLEVNTHALGACMSAGSLILQAGKTRSASPATSLMVHFGEETNSSGSEAIHNAKLTKRFKDYYAKRSGKSMRTVNTWLEKDTYFTPEEALKAGLIDEVKA